MHRRNSLAAQRFTERRRREDDAPRLSAEVPDLQSLRLDIEERAGLTGTQPKHIRHVVIDRAPAVFFVRCGDPQCDGGHDLTKTVMHALRAHEKTFGASDDCKGSVAGVACERVIHFAARAQYRPKKRPVARRISS